jgi:fucose 4-O-acetylase-like acetyltransferase
MYRWGKGNVRTFRFNKEGLYSMGLLVAGIILWALIPGAHVIREGYVELFYPPVAGLLVFSAGFFLLALIVLDHLLGQYSLMDPLRATGECALAIYLLHYAIIEKIISPLDIRLPLPEFFFLYLVLLVSMILVAYLLRYIRKIWRHQPFLVRFLIGG